MSYQENYQKWVSFADFDYLRQDLENMDEKTKGRCLLYQP